MKTNIRKYTNISVATAVAISGLPVQAFAAGTGLSILDDAMFNFTSPGKFEYKDSDGNLISTDYYTGGVSYSFGNDYPPAIFSVSPPTIEAGCNGINIKGMFISLLGLDQLGSMLQNAGASLAWGVAIGLIYSLPGVASAFKMINQWAKDLQKLLGNACQSGIAIGQFIAKTIGLDKGAMEKKIMNAIPDWAKCGQEGENCIVHALGLDDYFSSDGIFNYGGSNELPEAEKADVVTKLLRGVFAADISVGSSYMTSLVKKDVSRALLNRIGPVSGNTDNKSFGFNYFSVNLKPGGPATVPDVQGNTVTMVDIDDFASYFPSQTAKTKAKLGVWAYVLIYNYIGDLILKNTNSKIHEALDLSDGVVSSASAGDKKKALQSKENMEGLSANVVLSGPGGNVDYDSAGRRLANLIVYGNKGAEGARKLSMPGFVIVATKEEKATEKSFKIIARDPSEFNHSETIDDYNGVEFESNCAVRNKIASGSAIGCSSQNTSFPVLIEDIDYFVKVVKNSPESKREELTQALVKYNEWKMASGLLSTMFRVLRDANSAPAFMKKSSTGNLSNSNIIADSKQSGAEQQHAYLDKAGKTIFRAQKEIEKLSGDLTAFTKIKSMFKAQELENRSRGMKTTIK